MRLALTGRQFTILKYNFWRSTGEKDFPQPIMNLSEIPLLSPCLPIFQKQTCIDGIIDRKFNEKYSFTKSWNL